MRLLKYFSAVSFYILAYISFTSQGFICYLTLIYAWILIPALELIIPPNLKNLEKAEEDLAKQNPWYDYVLYVIVLLQLPILFFFLNSMQEPNLTLSDIVARVLTMGLLCGTFGINVGHELGHRNNFIEQTMAKLLLSTSLYMHFFIEHNKGHHKHVATPNDPSSARLGESLYVFYYRTIVYSYLSAWKIANEECVKKGKPVFSMYNEMLQAHLWQLLLVTIIYLLFGGLITFYFLLAAVFGFLLLETVNYIEHYGLSRKQNENGKYERAMPHHSWNSNHILGRMMLFELSRHSDHHYLASRKYQILQHHQNAPQMPTGYPGMMILSLFPPLWFKVMHKQMEKYNY
ncbi:MAG: alkane 1-monooxygenase [Chitinophagaceae bacterium]